MTDGSLDVVLVRWPADEQRLERLRAHDTPHLLMVEPGACPPVPDPGLEDWIRLPASSDDVRLRVEGLLGRAARHGSPRPAVGVDGVIRYRGRSVAVSPTETALLETLTRRWGSVVGRHDLQALLPAADSSNALDAGISRLRRRVAPLGLVIRAVRRRGYLLESTV